MNKKIMLIGSLALILAMGLVFMGCSQDADDEEVTPNIVYEERGGVVGFGNASTAQSVEFVQAFNGATPTNVWIISWRGVADVAEYEIFWQQYVHETTTGTTTIPAHWANTKRIYGDDYYTVANTAGEHAIAPTNEFFYTAVQGDATVTDESDLYEATANSTDADGWYAVIVLEDDALGCTTGNFGRLGVLAKPLSSKDKNLQFVWSDGFLDADDYPAVATPPANAHPAGLIEVVAALP